MGMCLAMAAWAGADEVVLKGGYKVSGDVLKATDEVVIVDLGTMVVRLERANVRSIRRGAPAATAPASGPASRPAGARERQGAAWQLYRTAELEPTTIERNTERFGEAVVVVTTPGGQGSGFLISPEGHLITNYHVIANETRIKVTVFSRSDRGFEQKHYKKVRILALNPFVDLALLKIEQAAKPFTYAYLGSMDAIEAGQQCFAIGNPLGLTRTVSQGIISTKNRNFEGRLYIQTTADINPGNSGGPLFNRRGEVVGVTSMGYLFLGGLNFAVPVDVVKRFIENRDAFAYDEDNPNAGQRYLQPAGRQDPAPPPPARLPDLGPPPRRATPAAAPSAPSDDPTPPKTSERSRHERP
jgi:serine protease Do